VFPPQRLKLFVSKTLEKQEKSTETMVCPYRATTGFITAVLSMIYLHSTYADDGTNKKLVDNEDHKKKPMSPARRMALIVVLVLFHVDLFTTGYFRSGVKAGISMVIQQASVQA
jgi:hypothetical protein